MTISIVVHGSEGIKRKLIRNYIASEFFSVLRYLTQFVQWVYLLMLAKLHIIQAKIKRQTCIKNGESVNGT